ncbi:diguanylate cyclase domain-containing protein [Noviherbaspirillum autotrophicum]|uniref:Diguanylate cyclase n=1 Tax=Noviherbaspirillum autotrophicum TaxID=709839 RepID=A0A0C1YQ58_9BURK|nr:diguanylate cyclase [Noviherbaspirillum autotrophicum]KIF82757.1 diguanylate cyclase [Noviherbaspirillum autotrophicum]
MDPNAHALLPNIADLLLDAVFLVDVHGRVVYVNAACERIFGYTPDELIGRSMIDFVAPEDRARTWNEAMQVMAGRPRIGFENRYIRKDGRQVHVMWSARWSPENQLRIGVARDITERKHAQEMQAATYAVSEAAHAATDLGAMYREIHRIVANLVPLAGFAVATCDPKTKQLGFPYQMDLYGNSPIIQEPTTRQYCIEVICSGQPMLLTDAVLATPGGDTSMPAGGAWLVMPLITQNETIGALILKSLPGTTYSDKEKGLLQFVSAQVATAMERKRLSVELLRAARHDELTGLPNRRLFQDRMASALARCKRKQGRIALLYLDIDDFKQVNDSLGHAAGDVLLQEVAQRITHCVREEDTVARLGGDEFVVLLEDVRTADDVMLVADKIRHAIRQPIHVDGFALKTRTSIGTALYPEHGMEAEELLKQADKAMYLDKKFKARTFK